MKHSFLLLVHIAVYGGFAYVIGWPDLWLGIIFAFLLIWVSCVDFALYEIPDAASGLLVVTGLYAHWSLGQGIGPFLLAALCWFLIFWLVARLARLRLGQDGLGFGDVKLMAGIGAWLGLVAPIYVVLCASLAGIGMIVITQRAEPQAIFGKMVAFGPFLCLSAWAVWLSGVGS